MGRSRHYRRTVVLVTGALGLLFPPDRPGFSNPLHPGHERHSTAEDPPPCLIPVTVTSDTSAGTMRSTRRDQWKRGGRPGARSGMRPASITCASTTAVNGAHAALRSRSARLGDSGTDGTRVAGDDEDVQPHPPEGARRGREVARAARSDCNVPTLTNGRAQGVRANRPASNDESDHNGITIGRSRPRDSRNS